MDIPRFGSRSTGSRVGGEEAARGEQTQKNHIRGAWHGICRFLKEAIGGEGAERLERLIGSKTSKTERKFYRKLHENKLKINK